MSHSTVALTSKFLKLCALSKLELPDKPVGNIATFKVFSSVVLSHIFDFVYIGDAIEFCFSSPYDQEELEQTCRNIFTVCHEIMPNVNVIFHQTQSYAQTGKVKDYMKIFF